MLAAILLVTVPPLVLPRKMNERLKASRDAFSLQMAGYTQQLKELLGGFEVIRGFLREDAYAARHRDAARQARDSEQAYQQSLNAMVVNTSLISNLIFPIVMLVGLFLAFDGRLTMGTVSTAASMANFVITPCNQIAQCWAKVRSSKGIRQRLEAAMSGPEKVSAGRAIGKLEHIECKDTGFSYPGAAAPVLRGVRLTVSGRKSRPRGRKRLRQVYTGKAAVPVLPRLYRQHPLQRPAAAGHRPSEPLPAGRLHCPDNLSLQ